MQRHSGYVAIHRVLQVLGYMFNDLMSRFRDDEKNMRIWPTFGYYGSRIIVTLKSLPSYCNPYPYSQLFSFDL